MLPRSVRPPTAFTVRSATTLSTCPLSPSSGRITSSRGGDIRASAPPRGSPPRRVPGAPAAPPGSAARGRPPLGGRGSLRKTGPRSAGPKPTSARRAGKFIVCLGRRRHRHRAGSAAGSETARCLHRPDSPRPAPGAAGAARPERRGAPEPQARSLQPDLQSLLLAAPTPAPGAQLVPEKPGYSPGASAAPLRGSAPSPAPQAPYSGHINLTPPAQGGKVWE